jgi:hypothetical protein
VVGDAGAIALSLVVTNDSWRQRVALNRIISTKKGTLSRWRSVTYWWQIHWCQLKAGRHPMLHDKRSITPCVGGAFTG